LVVRTAQDHLYTYDTQSPELKYLLNREEIENSAMVVVSPFYPRLFQMNSSFMQSIAISSGYLYVSKVDK
jgi:hypothetical protein